MKVRDLMVALQMLEEEGYGDAEVLFRTWNDMDEKVECVHDTFKDKDSKFIVLG